MKITPKQVLKAKEVPPYENAVNSQNRWLATKTAEARPSKRGPRDAHMVSQLHGVRVLLTT